MSSRSPLGLFDSAMVVYFALHIPTTLLIDAQSILPKGLFPTLATNLLKWHIAVNGDLLVKENQPWFQALVWFELLFQLPFFFLALYGYIQRKKWIRIPLLVYGVHTATTLVPILGEIIFRLHNWKLSLIYAPYFIVPLALAVKNAIVVDPFPARIRRKVKAKRS